MTALAAYPTNKSREFTACQSQVDSSQLAQGALEEDAICLLTDTRHAHRLPRLDKCKNRGNNAAADKRLSQARPEISEGSHLLDADAILRKVAAHLHNIGPWSTLGCWSADLPPAAHAVRGCKSCQKNDMHVKVEH